MIRWPPTSRRNSQIDWAVTFFGAACLFWVSAHLEIFTMPPEMYGAAMEIPAEVWSGLLVFSSAVWLFGIYINGRWRWSPLLRVAGCGGHLTFNLIFLWTSATAPMGDVVALFSVSFALANARFLALNLRDLWRVI